MDNNELFFLVAQLHTDLLDTNAKLLETRREREFAEATDRIRSQIPIVDEDVAQWSGDYDVLKARESELLTEQRAALERLLPRYLELAESEFARLDDELSPTRWDNLSEACFETLETVVNAFYERLGGMVSTWNHAAECLIRFSAGLPAEEIEQKASRGGSGAPASGITRIRATEPGAFVGITIGGRTTELVSKHEVVGEFLDTLERNFAEMMKNARTALLSGVDKSTQVELVLNPNRLVWRSR